MKCLCGGKCLNFIKTIVSWTIRKLTNIVLLENEAHKFVESVIIGAFALVLLAISVAYAITQNAYDWSSEQAALDTMVLLYKLLIMLTMASALIAIKKILQLNIIMKKAINIFIAGMISCIIWHLGEVGMNTTFIVPVEVFSYKNIDISVVVAALFLFIVGVFLIIRTSISIEGKFCGIFKISRIFASKVCKVLVFVMGAVCVYILIGHLDVDLRRIVQDEITVESISPTAFKIQYRMLSGPQLRLQIIKKAPQIHSRDTVLYSTMIDRGLNENIHVDKSDTLSVIITRHNIRTYQVEYELLNQNPNERIIANIVAGSDALHNCTLLLSK